MKENKILMSYKLVCGANLPEGLKKLSQGQKYLKLFFFLKKNTMVFLL